MTLNALADFVGPVYLQLAYLGIAFCLGWFTKQGWDWAWPELRFRYKRRRVRPELLTWGEPRQPTNPHVAHGRGWWGDDAA